LTKFSGSDSPAQKIGNDRPDRRPEFRKGKIMPNIIDTIYDTILEEVFQDGKRDAAQRSFDSYRYGIMSKPYRLAYHAGFYGRQIDLNKLCKRIRKRS
jgi:hypothetical protein